MHTGPELVRTKGLRSTDSSGCDRYRSMGLRLLLLTGMKLDAIHRLRRRAFLGGAVACMAQTAAAQGNQTLPRPKETRKGDMLYRSFGNTGENVSVIGVGGAHIGKANSEEEATRIVRTAVDRGVNFMDNSWDYNDIR